MTWAEGPFLRLGIFLGGLLLFLVLELLVPYRRPSVSKLKRWLINLGLTAINSAFLSLVAAGAVVATAAYVTENKLGVLNLLALPGWIKVLATLAFMDFMLYVWHLLNHEMPFLWRFHRVHHVDLNMDASTATRFHLGELLISALIKIGLVFFIGADLIGLLIFESALVLFAQFHHSSLRIPAWLDSAWLIFSIPPSAHRVHHSVKIRERNTNYGTIFSFWDRVLGTLKTDVDQDGIIIGVGGHFEERKLGLGRLLAMPFIKPVR